jgi:hypothetical protein
MSFKTDSIATVANYDELVAFQDTSVAVLVTDPDIGGLFFPKTTGQINYGTIFRSSYDLNYFWHRSYDGKTLSPEWWPTGGSATQVDVIFDGGDQITEAMNAGGDHCTVILKSGKTYSVSQKIGCTVGSTIDLNGAVIKRADDDPTTLAVDYVSGETEVVVVDASNYRIGDVLWIGDTTEPFGGLGFGEDVIGTGATVLTITGISGNVITIANAANTVKSVAAANSTVRRIVKLLDYPNICGDFRVKNGTIDGNSDNCLVRSWKKNNTLSQTINGAGYPKFEKVRFQNLPAENATGACFIFDSCWFENLQGSLVHVSNGATTYLNPVVITNCYINNVNLGTDAQLGHSEGAITMSAQPINVTISNSHFQNGSESIFGGIGADNLNVTVTNSSFYNFSSFVAGGDIGTTVSGFVDNIHITNCLFENCGDLIFRSGDVAIGRVISNLTFNGNTVYNGRFFISGLGMSQITGNNFIYDTNKGDFTGFTDELVSSFSGYIVVADCDRINIVNNIIEGGISGTTHSDVGIFLPLEENGITTGRYRNSSNLTETNFIYPQQVRISGNNISGFKQGISTMLSVYSEVETGQALGWLIDKNIIFINRLTPDDSIGIVAQCGMVVDGNIIVFGSDNTSSNQITTGVLCIGVTRGASTDNEQYMGVICKNNTIIGEIAHPIYIGTGVSDRGSYNNVISNNTAQNNIGTGVGAVAGRNLIQNNNEATSVNITSDNSLTNIEPPFTQGWQQNTDWY